MSYTLIMSFEQTSFEQKVFLKTSIERHEKVHNVKTFEIWPNWPESNEWFLGGFETNEKLEENFFFDREQDLWPKKLK